MGNNNSRPPLADLDIYICGNVERYSGIINSIFTIKSRSLNNTINLKGINEEYYNKGQYEYEYLKLLNKTKNIKGENVENIYNAFLFSNNVNQEFADILFFYLKEYDVHNKRKNVIISFGYENIILNSMIRLKSVSQESIPIVIIIDRNFIYDERLDYINYIPSFSTIKKNLIKENQNYDRITLNYLSKKCLITYIKTKLFRICAYYNEMGYKLNMINPLNDINAKIALVGDSGTGKSTLLNIVFNELVSKANISSEDVTLKCSEYYLTVQTANENDENIGQLRFLDFPGLNENKNFILVENEINSKLKEYKTNLEQIDIALFFIRNGQGRTINENHKKLIDLLSKNNIKILFIINGGIDKDDLSTVKQSLKNSIRIIEKDYNNLIFTNYKKRPDLIKRDGISVIFQKILEIIQVNIINFNINTINNENYRTVLNNLYRTNRIFQIYENFEAMQASTKKKQ
jgi:GTPase Era involved in 16S rRNA processing